MESRWLEHEGVLYTTDLITSNKIAGFDMDSTIIKTKSNSKYPVDANDWELLYDNVKDKIKSLYNDNYNIVIITNQSKVEDDKKYETEIKTKIENIINELGVPIKVLIATKQNYYRKPSTGCWELINQFAKLHNIVIDNNQSFYCGDAAGRVYKKNKDHSNSDYLFALNCKLKFYTPEMLFLNKLDTIPEPNWSPLLIPETQSLYDDNKEIKMNEKQMLILCGSPGSGKSTFCVNNLNKFEVVNQDKLKTATKCIKMATELMKQNKNIVIDNTNRYAKDRKPYIDLAKQYMYDVKCLYFKFPKEYVFHLNNQRKFNKFHKHITEPVDKIVIHSWYKYLEEPDISEGFSEIKKVNIKLGPFDNDDDKQFFYNVLE